MGWKAEFCLSAAASERVKTVSECSKDIMNMKEAFH